MNQQFEPGFYLNPMWARKRPGYFAENKWLPDPYI